MTRLPQPPSPAPCGCDCPWPEACGCDCRPPPPDELPTQRSERPDPCAATTQRQVRT
jgi:hypothetical protein